MKLRKLEAAISLVAVIGFVCMTVLPISSATAASGITATQKSQIMLLMAYGHLPNGKSPSYNQSLSVVLANPSVPTMAEGKLLGMEDSTVIPTATVNVALQLQSTNQATGNQTYTGKFSWWHGPTYAKGFGWHQFLTITYNYKQDKILSRSTYGYYFVSDWCSWLWHYVGEYTSEGFPKWFKGGGGKILHWVKYQLIENFGWGYGPISGQLTMRMYIIGYADGLITGGNF